MTKKYELKKIGLAMEAAHTRRHPSKLSGIGLQFFAAPADRLADGVGKGGHFPETAGDRYAAESFNQMADQRNLEI